MNIDTNITKASWNPPEEIAKNYLHYYPKEMKIELSKYMKSVSDAPSVIDIGCGNAQIYPILKAQNPNLEYVGIDNSETLVNVAREVVKDDGEIIQTDIFDYMDTNQKQFDFAILAHMIECIESPDMIMDKASKAAKYVAIHWYDTPKYEYDVVTVGKSPHPGEGFNPYIRRRMGKNYWKYITQRYGLSLVHKAQVGENNVLEVYTRA